MSLLSAELKASLGNQKPMSGSKKKKKKQDKEPKKKSLTKQSRKRREAAERLQKEQAALDQRADLFDRIRKAALPEETALRSSRLLTRKGPKTEREVWAETGTEEEAAEDENDSSSDAVVIRPRQEFIRLPVPRVLPSGQPASKKAKAEPKGPVVASVPVRPDPVLESRVFDQRPSLLRQQRASLPATSMEGEVMDQLAQHDVVLVCGATGSGKTTQLPQWLLEHGYGARGRVVVTQPRRVAARMVSERVAEELGQRHGGLVGYRVRGEGKYSAEETILEFVTDGLLLAQMGDDVLLEGVSVVVVDEAHERTLGTDVLLGMLARVGPLRRRRYAAGESDAAPLKLVVMSATLALAPIAELFGADTPVVQVEGRQYPVETHWLRVTPDGLPEALERAAAAVRSIHSGLPTGTVLVFVPGKQEISWLMTQLQSLADDLDLCPLHSGQTPMEQRRAFNGAREEGMRLVVLATNLAECALTIPGVRYVVDTGYARIRTWAADGEGLFSTARISQASATQRAGRAGRTQGGHCYRLYSQPLFYHHMPEFDLPQTLLLPPDQLVLTLLSLGISNPHRFPLPDPPLPQSLQEASTRLMRLGLVASPAQPPLQLTRLGAQAASLPVAPTAARLLLALAPSGQTESLSPSLIRLASLLCAVWTVGHQLWAGDADPDVRLQINSSWKRAVASCESMQTLFVLCNALPSLRKGLGMPGHAVGSALTLAEQIQTRWTGQRPTSRMQDVTLEPPSPAESLSLRQALLGATCFNLMRREGDHYIRLLDGAEVHLHPRRCAQPFRAAACVWISSLELAAIEEGRLYAINPFEVAPAWLPHVLPEQPSSGALVDYSRVDIASVEYDIDGDQLSALVSPRFGPKLAPLPNIRLPLTSATPRLPELFGSLLFAGSVVPALAAVATHLVLPPDSLRGPAPTPAQKSYLALKIVSRTQLLELLPQSKAMAIVLSLYVPAARRAVQKVWKTLLPPLVKQ